MSGSAKAELARRTVEVVKAALQRYSLEFPDRIGDDRNADALAWSYRGIDRIIKLFDEYDIRFKNGGNGKAAKK